MNSQGQAQAAQVAEQAKQQTMQMEYELKMRFMVAEKAEERKNIEIKGQYDLERERISGTGRVEASYVQARERQDSNVRNNTTTLIKENKGEEVGKINIKNDLTSTIEPMTTPENPNLNIEIPEEESTTPPILSQNEEESEPQQESPEQENIEEGRIM